MVRAADYVPGWYKAFLFFWGVWIFKLILVRALMLETGGSILFVL